MVLKIWPTLPKIPTPVFVIIFSTVAVFGTAAFWFWFWAPEPEHVFWQTVEDNLSSRSVSFETRVWLDLPEQADVLLLDNRLDMNFETGGAYFRQKTLFYDSSISKHYSNPLQLAQYSRAGLETPPDQEWYEQECYITRAGAWARHDLYTRPAQDDWRQLFASGSETPPWGEEWQNFDLNVNNFLSWQHFLMISGTSGGFFYGHLNDVNARAELLSLLHRAYKVDFSRTRSFRRHGRPFYEYQVGFDQALLGQAFVYYFNAHAEAIGLEERLDLTPDQAANIFLVEDSSHTVVIDAWSARIASIEHPLEIGPGWLAQGLTEDFVVVPLLSPIIGDATLKTRLPLTVKTSIAAQDQRLDFEASIKEREAAQ